MKLTLAAVKENQDFHRMIQQAHSYMQARGYTEHGFRHVNYVAQVTAKILRELGYDDRTVELGAIAGYLHDVGNMFNRKYHGITGANIVYTELRQLGVPLTIFQRSPPPLLTTKRKLATRSPHYRRLDYRRQERCPSHPGAQTQFQ